MGRECGYLLDTPRSRAIEDLDTLCSGYPREVHLSNALENSVSATRYVQTAAAARAEENNVMFQTKPEVMSVTNCKPTVAHAVYDAGSEAFRAARSTESRAF